MHDALNTGVKPVERRAARLCAQLLTMLFATIAAGCGGSGSNEPSSASGAVATTAETTSLQISLSSDGDAGAEKNFGTGNLIDISDRWTGWDGSVSNVFYEAATHSLRIGTPEAGRDMAIGVRRFEQPLTAGTRYTLSVRSDNPQAAAILFLFDSTGRIIPIDAGSGETLAISRDGAPLTFVAPADVAGFFLQVQNEWRATSPTSLVAELVSTPGGAPTGENLVAMTGPWTDWTGRPTAVTLDADGRRLVLQAPFTGQANTIAVRRFATPLVAGAKYSLWAGEESDDGAAVLLFLFDANGHTIEFQDMRDLAPRPWIAATREDPKYFVAPAGVARFAIQVQSPWHAAGTTRIAPWLQRFEVVACFPARRTFEHLVDTQAHHDQPGSLAMSDDGNVIAFTTYSTDAVDGDGAVCTGDPACLRADVFILERSPRRITRVTPASADGTSPNISLSGDGRFLLFESTASNLIIGESDANGGVADVFLLDRSDGVIRRVSAGTSPLPHRLPGFSLFTTPRILSRDGRMILYTRLRPGLDSLAAAHCRLSMCEELLLLDRTLGTVSTPLVTLGNYLSLSSMALSGNGRFLAVSDVGTGSRAMLHLDLATGSIRRFSAIYGFGGPSMSFDGQTLVFNGDSRNLLPGETVGGVGKRDTFVVDLRQGSQTRLYGYPQPQEWSVASQVSSSGKVVAVTMAYGESMVDRSEIFVNFGPTDAKSSVVGKDFGFPTLSADGRVMAVRGTTETQSGIFVAEIDYPCMRH